MSDLADHLAELTRFRDRELLDVTLVGALRELLQPRRVAIWRSVGEPGDLRWLLRASLAAEDLVATADPGWVDVEALPRHEPGSPRVEAFSRQAVLQLEGDPAVTLLPFGSDRETTGVLEIESAQPMSAAEMRLVKGVLRICRNFQGLLDYSERDTLTGLLNRRTFDETFMKLAAVPAESACAGADERRRPPAAGSWWLGVIDIDHFKRVNDQHGHLIGDEVLLLLARLMRNAFRYDDRLYRFGGEEFVVLMRCGSTVSPLQAFERLRTTVEGYAFPQVGRLTISVGLTEVRGGDTPSSAFERADQAVYHAKGNGRNRVSEHERLVASGALRDDTKVGDVELF